LLKSLTGITISFSLFAFSAQAQAPSFTAASVVNAASMVAGAIAPGMVVNITGTNLGDPTFFRSCTSSYPITTTCFGISVLVNGTPAPVFNNSSTRLVFQAPFGLTGASATIQVTSNLSGSTLSSPVVTVPLAVAAPGMFTTNSLGTGTAYYFVTGGLIIDYSQPVLAGDTVVMLGTGFGATNPAVVAGSLAPNAPAGTVAGVTMTINNQTVPVTFAGLEPGNVSSATAGYDEVVFTAPTGLPIPAGQASAAFPVVVTVGGVASPPVNLIVAPPPPSITSISPNPVPLSAGSQTLTFTGSGFQSGLTVAVEGPNGAVTIPASSVTLISSTQFSISLTVGTVGGTWSIVVTDPTGAASDTFVFTSSGTAPTPTITSVITTASGVAQISQDGWIEVHGTNLSQVTDTWNSLPASAFVGTLPTLLDNVSATVDGKPAAVFYVSNTQVNILAPIDSALGTVSVQMNTPNGTVSKTVTEVASTPAFFVIDGAAGHVAAQHLNYSYLGPPSLNGNGYTFTPAAPGETVILYGTGFGQTTPALTNEATAGGSQLPVNPSISIGGVPAVVNFAGISGAGLYQFNVVVPAGTPNGDATLSALYNGNSTQSNVLITVHN